MKTVFKIKSISVKLLIPVSLIIIFSFGGLGFLIYNQESRILTENIKAEAFQGLDEVNNTIKTAEAAIKSVKEGLTSNYISNAKLIAQLIANDISLLDTKKLNTLAYDAGVDEIHIIDERGLIASSTVVEFIGYDMASSEQSKEFLVLINDKTKTIAQEPMPRGVDKTLFQYIGVPRLDSPGVVQIGIRPVSVQKITEQMDIVQYIKNRKLSKTGYYFIVNRNGIITAHPQQDMIGIDINKYDWGTILLKGEGNDFFYNQNNVNMHMFFKKQGDLIICATIQTSDYLGPLSTLRDNILMTAAAAIFICIIIICLISNRTVVKPLKKMMGLMSMAEKGDFTVKSDITGIDEIGKLSVSFNSMVSDVNMLIRSVLNAINNVSGSANSLAVISEETAASTAEIANNIQQIAEKSKNGADNAAEGANTINDLAQKIEYVISSSKSMKTASYDSKELNRKGLESISVVTSKFEDNKRIALEISELINSLSSKSENIEEITKTITTIAKQTNLLALNAAIEAARAGEYGKGFAVVADEIKKLAVQAAKEADEITKIVSDINNETSLAVAKMDVASKLVDDVNSSLSDAGAIFAKINNSNEELLDIIDNVDRNIDMMKSDKDRIVHLVNNILISVQESAATSQEIAATIEEQNASVEEVTASTQELNSLAKQMQDAAERFKIE